MRLLWSFVGILIGIFLMSYTYSTRMEYLEGKYLASLTPVYLNGCSWAVRRFQTTPTEADFQQCKDQAVANKKAIEEIFWKIGN